jgi:tRNA G18 (ribose-2'-O)-methylase SpoU
MSPGTLAADDVRAGIPVRRGVESLNVGVAAGIAL